MIERESLRGRLAGAIAGVSAVVVLAFGAVVYRQMNDAATRAASEHLEAVDRELVTALGASARTLRTTMAAVAEDSSVVAGLRSPDDPRRIAAARASLQRLEPATGGADVELLMPDGRPVIGPSPGWPPLSGGVLRATTALVGGADSLAVGPIFVADTTLAYSAAARVGPRSAPHGYILVRRHVTSRGEARQFREIVGLDASVLVGNTGGSVWTNFANRVAPPPVSTASQAVVQYERPGVGAVFASMAPVAYTPWTVVVEFPRASVLRDVQRSMLVVVGFGLLALLLAAGVAWWLSGSYTRPLAEVAAAAEAISGGEYGRQVPVHRDDEVGATATAFNRMSESLRAGRAELEAKVTEAASSMRRLERVIAASGAVLYELWPMDGVLTIAWISDNVPAVLGYSAAEALEPGWWSDHVHPDDLARLAAQGEPAGDNVREYRFRHKDGRYRWMRDDQRSVSEDDGKTHVVGTWLDITEQRHLEEQLRHAQKMEAIGTLAGGVAHDFNNILTVVTSYAEILARTEDDDERRSDLDEIVAAARRATLLTRQLLTFSRKSLAEKRTVNVSAVVGRMGGMLRRLLKENIKLVPRLSDAVAPVVADPNQLEQVLMNLAVNAADAMPDGGTLVIETQNIELDDAYARSHGGVAPGRYVMLAVTDTGTGIEPAIMEKIFEPFFTTKPPGHGTGLGLASVYAIVKEAGGHVWAYSERGQGTTFKIYLPWAGPSAMGDQALAVPDELRMTGTALLVEDDVRVRRAVRRMLERIGFDVIEASDGESGLGVAAGHEGRIDLVVTDLMMPRLGGGAFAKRLALSRPGVPVVFTSGYTDDAAFRRGLLESDYTFVQKPFTREHLEAAISRVTRKARAAQG